MYGITYMKRTEQANLQLQKVDSGRQVGGSKREVGSECYYGVFLCVLKKNVLKLIVMIVQI